MFDFDELTDRFGTNSLKWDCEKSELPMWIADMDFRTAPAVAKAVAEKAQSGIYGYQCVPVEWYNAYRGWWKRRYNFDIEREWLQFACGVVPVVTSAVKRLTNAGDNVVVQTPVYNCFFSSVENTGRHLAESPLIYRDGEYSMDFDDLEKKLADPLTTLMILCNPHNPAGKIWTREELARVGALCKKHGVVVISDEIHCDITPPGQKYIPFASVNEECRDNCVVCLAPSKTFNMGGMQTAAAVVPNRFLREKVVRGLNSDELAEPNVFAVEAAVAAYEEGEKWADEMRAYVAENHEIAKKFLETEVKEVKLVKQNATYLLWVDCSGITDDTAKLCDFIRKHTGLYITAGGIYRGNGNKFVRINIACPKSRMLDGLNRFKRGIRLYKE